MIARKIASPFLFNGHSILRNAIVSTDSQGRILEVRENPGGIREEAGLEYYNGILCPGFINAHCHLELSHMKGQIDEGMEMDNFIYAVINYRSAEPERIDQAIIEADREMRQEGIVAVGDICNTSDGFECKRDSPIQYHNFVEIFNMVNAAAEKTWEQGMAVLEKARNEYHLSCSLVPHASYSVSEKLFALFRNRLDDPENRMSIHNEETLFEEDFIRDRKGRFLDLFEKLGFEKGDSRPRNMGSLEYLIESLPPKPPLLLVHNVHTGEESIRKSPLDISRCHFCLCPNSNLYISSRLPSRWLMDHYPEKICLGTDSLASNRRLSILEELKTLSAGFPDLSLEKLLSFATLNGAKALGLDSSLGTVEQGKRPGLVLIEDLDLSEMKLTKKSKVKVLVSNSTL